MAQQVDPSRYISKLSNKLRREMDRNSFRGTYSGSQGKALHFILAHEGEDVFQRDIEEEFGLRPPSATALLKKMEASGLIHRESVPYDRRMKRIVATPKALAYRQQVMADLERLEKKLRGNLTDRELETWADLSQRIIENL